MKILINIACFFLVALTSLGQSIGSIEYSDERGIKIKVANTADLPDELMPLFTSELLTGRHLDTVPDLDSQQVTYTIMQVIKESENQYHLRVLWEKGVYLGHIHYSMSTREKPTGLMIESMKYLYMEI